ncbi:hypothetical protein D9Q98_006724 [Chlorella vulgaris]|uniref:Pyrimidine 5-nucleotidase n=1 Tax=Chlorella vulgaris TaxID=3077 RepID=A0A9D4TKZ8_CHLVU|nr:hypothetical protein D9Q98_006724 [Chlorella vulgaris]
MTITQRPQVTAILCDLDDCLYQNHEMQYNVAENIRHYMAEHLSIDVDTVAELCADLYLNYGTTLAGLVASGYKVDYEDWHARVHGSLPYETYLHPDPALRSLLDSIPLPKWVFTNADAKHAARCLDLLGLSSCFQGVISFEEVMAEAAQQGMVHHGCPVVCKPNRQAFDIAMQLAGGLQPGTTLWLDDSARNITTGHRLGLYSVLVGRTGVACPSDQQIRSMHDLPAALPWLWQGQQPPCGIAAAAAPEGDESALPLKAAIGKPSSGKVHAKASCTDDETIEAVYAAT